MADELKQLTERIKSSADKRYALKEEASVAQNVEISYEGGGSGFTVIVRREDVHKTYNGLTEQQVIDLVNSKTSDIANATTEIQHPVLNTVTNYVTLYNETAPITNNTIWKNDVSVPNGIPYPFAQVQPITDNRFVVCDSWDDGIKGAIFKLNNDGTFTKTHSFPVTYALISTWDGKRLIGQEGSNKYQFDLQDDGTYSQLDITNKINTSLGYLHYGGMYSHLKWDGLVLYALNKVYKIGDDGTWQEDNTIPNMIRKLDNASYVSWMNFVLPDLSLNMVYKSRGYDSIIHFFSKQTDGTYAEDPQLDLGDDKIVYGQITLDGKKMVCMAIDIHNNFCMLTYYRNEDKTWSFVSRNYTQADNISSSCNVLLTLDGKKAYTQVGNNGTSTVLFEQQVEQQSTFLDANSTDPFGDGSLIHFLPLDNDLNDTIGSIQGYTYTSDGDITTNMPTSEGKFSGGRDVSANVLDISDQSATAIDYSIETVSLWIKKLVDDVSDAVILGSLADDTKFKIGPTSISLGDNVLDSINLIPTINEWTHIVVTPNTDKLDFYSNGVLIGSVTRVEDAIYTIICPNEISWNGGYESCSYFNGYIDHVQIFDRALTQDEITQLYNAEVIANNDTLDANSTNPFGDGSLKHFYKLDENLDDTIPNGLNLSSVGTVTYVSGKFNQGTKLTDLGEMYINQNVFASNGTVNMWIKLIQYKNDTTLFATNNLNEGSQYVNALYVLSNGKLQIVGRETSGDAFTRYATSNETVFLNHLTMLTITKTDNRVEIFKNGILVCGADKASFDTSSFKTHFGYHNSTEHADSTMFDHIQIFDRVLTQEEITQLYNANKNPSNDAINGDYNVLNTDGGVYTKRIDVYPPEGVTEIKMIWSSASGDGNTTTVSDTEYTHSVTPQQWNNITVNMDGSGTQTCFRNATPRVIKTTGYQDMEVVTFPTDGTCYPTAVEPKAQWVATND
jgi:hypothetical protein